MAAYEKSGYSLGSTDPLDKSQGDVKKMRESAYQSAYPACSVFWQQATLDKRMKSGDQAFNNMIYGDNTYNNSKRFFFNLIRKHVNMICGYQRRNRKSTVAMPVHQNDDLADEFNAVMKFCEEKDGFQEYFSQAFEGAVDVGMSLLHMYMDYSQDPVSGDILTENIAFNNFLIDPYWRKMDLSDCRFIWLRKWASKEEAMSLLPQAADKISKMRPPGTTDGKFPYQAELLNKNTNDLYPIDYFYYRDTREVDSLVDPYTQETVIWEETAEDEAGDILEIMKMQPWLKRKKVSIPTVKLCITIGETEIYQGPNLLGIDEYPFVPLVSYYDPDLPSYVWRCQGVIRNVRDAQFLFNLRKVIELDILQSQVTSGWIYPVDLLTDPKALRQSGQGYIIPIKAGRSPDEMKRIEPPVVPQSMIELSERLSKDITDIIGATEELMGVETGDQSGVVTMARQAAGLTSFQGIFDKADFSQRLYGKIRFKTVRKKFTTNKIRSILGHSPNPLFFRAATLKYNIAVEEGSYSTTQRQTELQQLLYFKNIGIEGLDDRIIDVAFITNKKALKESIAQQKQGQEQAQQMQAQMQQQREVAEIEEIKAASQEKIAGAQERLSRIEENAADAEHKRTAAELDLVRAMMGLEQMDLETIEKNYNVAQNIRNASQGVE